MKREWPHIQILVPVWSSTRDADDLRRDLASVLVSSSIEVISTDFTALPDADLLIADASALTSALEYDERTISTFERGAPPQRITIPGRLALDENRCHRIALTDTAYNDSMRLLERYHFAAALGAHVGHPRIDGLREVGQAIGAREVRSFSRVATYSASYTTLEHDECSTPGLLLARYLQAYDPDLPR